MVHIIMVLAGVLLLAKKIGVMSSDNLESIKDQSLDKHLTVVNHDGVRSRFLVGQNQSNVRGPFGSNPQEKYINDFRIFDNPVYQKKYQDNIRNKTVKNNYGPMDHHQFGILNNFQSLTVNQEGILEDLAQASRRGRRKEKTTTTV